MKNDTINITLVVDNKATHSTINRQVFWDLYEICDDNGAEAIRGILWEMFKDIHPKCSKSENDIAKRNISSLLVVDY